MLEPNSNCKYEVYVEEKNPNWNPLKAYICHNKSCKNYGKMTKSDQFGNSICDKCKYAEEK